MALPEGVNSLTVYVFI